MGVETPLYDLSRALDFAPAVFLLLVVANDALPRIPILNSLLFWLLKPLHRFLTESDLSEFDAAHGRVPPTTWHNFALILFAAAQAAGWCCFATYAFTVGEQSSKFVAGLLTAATWTLFALRTLITQPATPPYVLLAFAAVAETNVALRLWLESGIWWVLALEATGVAVILGIGVFYPMEPTIPGPSVAPVGAIPSDKFTSPEDGVSFKDWLTFGWMEPLFKLASVKTLDADNVWQLSPYFKHRNLFEKYITTRPHNPHQSLLWFLLSSNSMDLIITFTLQTYRAFVAFVPPYCLQQILAALESHDPARLSDAYLYALVIFVFHCSFAQVDLFDQWHARRAYERTRGQMFCALHWKSLKRRDMRGRVTQTLESKDGDGTEQAADIGRVVNLMTGDAYAVAQRFWEFPAVFVAPIRLTIALIYLYYILGWSCFAGVGVVLFAYVINYPLAKLNVSLTRKSWAIKDMRTSYVNEFFQSIRFLKYMGWERAWSNKVRTAREKELALRVKQNIVDVIIAFIWTWVPSAVILVSFLCYTIVAKEPLTVSKAFVSIEVFSQLQAPMSDLPNQIFALLHAFVSMQRIEKFLAEEEVEHWASSLKRETATPPNLSASAEVGFQAASFEWYSSAASREGTDTPATFLLKDLDLKFPAGKLSLIVGLIGSGKSSLLNALLGEMKTLSGKVFLDKSNHNVAYAAQHAWLEHATIRDNILFRTPYDPARYDAVLEACALKPDLKIFEAGDMTEIGEKGVSLSGGQRARVALARAVYSRAKVVLLDDPLAAVDMHTANHLVQQCFLGPLMKGRTILLVTHHVSICLPAAAYILELSNGSVLRRGTVEDLNKKGQLAEVIATEEPTSPTGENDSEETAVQKNEADQVTDSSGDVDTSKPPNKNAGKLIEEEHRAEGNVSLKTYLTYMKAAGWIPWSLIFILVIALRAVTVFQQFFLARWAQAYTSSSNIVIGQLSLQSALAFASSPFSNLPPPYIDVTPWLLIFTGISLLGALMIIAQLSVGYWGSLKASRTLFKAMLDRVSRAPTSFFDKTPVGRILNRFTADINAVDGALLSSVRNALVGTMTFIASFGVIVIVIPRFAPFALAIAAIYIKLAPPYVKASRDLRRLESIYLSPAFSGFDELLHGLIHVRAFGMEFSFQDRFYTIVDRFQGFDHFYWMASYWMKQRYDYLGSVIVYLTTLFALWTRVSEGMAALVIVNAGIFAEASRTLVRVFAQLELDFNSIERIGEYLQVEQEAPEVGETRPPAYWPSSNGGLQVENLVIQYAPTLPTVLKGISFAVKPREKVGVVGRTGSGKSTLALSLLRIIEPLEGRIILDGIDISTIGLDDLRGNITIVSQDVALFAGTVRSNLDPFDQHSDEECWNVLERCHLVSHSPFRTPSAEDDVSAQTNGAERRTVVTSLSQPVSPSGSSFSAGERQLLALARAMLRNALFTILDEASSSIDLETDDKIQRTIREEMKESLVLTIAHRLKTVIDYDRILVLDMGEIVEFDTPAALLSKEGGLFRDMCMKSADWDEIQSMVSQRQWQ